MKNPTLKIKLIMLFICSVTYFGCKKRENSTNAESKIIGVDPCTIKQPENVASKGFVLVLAKTGDTVVCYNLPSSIVTNIDTSVPLIKGFLLPSDKQVSLAISYSLAEENEKVWPVCIATIDLSGFSKINNKQIIFKPSSK